MVYRFSISMLKPCPLSTRTNPIRCMTRGCHSHVVSIFFLETFTLAHTHAHTGDNLNSDSMMAFIYYAYSHHFMSVSVCLCLLLKVKTDRSINSSPCRQPQMFSGLLCSSGVLCHLLTVPDFNLCRIHRQIDLAAPPHPPPLPPMRALASSRELSGSRSR